MDGPAPWRAWADRAGEMAPWADSLLVVRRDVWGGYYPALDSAGQYVTCQTTHPRKADRGRRLLTQDDLARHFRATSTRDVLGSHTTSPENLSRWGAVDIDQHGDHGPDPAKNLAAALAWYERLRGFGFAPLLTDSNGRGGYHLRVVFREPVPTPLAFAFMRQLVGDFADHGLTAAPETFPKQPRIDPGRFGNWLRLPGRHHTRPHWSSVWDGARWLDGHEAIDFMLALTGDPASLLPALPPPTPQPPRRVHRPAYRGGNLSDRISAFMRRLPHLGEGQGRDDVAFGFAAFLVRDLALSDDVAIGWLSLWDAGNRPPKGRDRLAEIIKNARDYGQRPVGSGLGRDPLARVVVVPGKRPGHVTLRCRVEVR
jgi:hypothetical protein